MEATENSAKMEGVLSTVFSKANLYNVISAIILFAVCYLLTKLVLKLLKRVLKKTQMQEVTQRAVIKFVSFVMYTIAFVLTAAELGINTSSIVALLSIMSLGITLAMEGILSNIAAGLVMTSTKPFVKGDYVKVCDVEGNVREIKLNHIRLETQDGTIVIVPNKEIASSKIINYTTKGIRRIVLDAFVPYDADRKKAVEALKEMMKKPKKVLDYPEPVVYLYSYEDSCIKYVLYCWVKTEDYLKTMFEINGMIIETLADIGIEMTYNHLNVHVMNDKLKEVEE